MRRHVTAAVLIGMVAGIAGPAAADHGGIHPTFAETRTYFHCVGPNKVQNLDGPAPWDTTAPTQSVEQGAGCGVVDPGLLINEEENTGFNFDTPFAGEATGNLSNMTVELWLLGHTNYSPVNGTLNVAVSLNVDGEALLTDAEVADIPLQTSSTGASHKLEFTIQGLGQATEVEDESGNVIDVVTSGYATEDGDGTTVREVELLVSTWYIDEVAGFVWDTTEVPSGITFNDATPASTKIAA